MTRNSFDKHFDYGSFLPLLLFILGLYVCFLFIAEEFSQGVFVMMLSFLLYVTNNVILNLKGFSTVFNEYLEDMATFLTFGLSTILFGLIFYKGSLGVLVVVFFYAICLVLGLARNWVLRFKNSLGWPLALNGIFFPLIYYIYQFYLQSPGNSIFIIFYLIIALFTISKYNFLGYEENNKEKFTVVDSREYEKRLERIEGKLERDEAEMTKSKNFSEKLDNMMIKMHHKEIPENKQGILNLFRRKRL